eukprot:9640615-Lingulodinium_polyedra.AAC.1
MCPHHVNSRKTRTLHASSSFHRAGQGRPLKLLAAWSLQGSSYPDKKSHMMAPTPSFEDRRAARHLLYQADATADFLALE